MIAEKSGTKWTILRTLREGEPASVKELQDVIDVSASTLNEHLSDLRAMNLVDKKSEKHGPGRPRHLYYLTDEAEHLFPHAYAELASMLMDVIRELAGEPGFRSTITEAVREQIQQYETLEVALQKLGFFPEITKRDDGETLTYHQCPFHDVAEEQPELCQIDRDVLEQITGNEVEMSSSIVDGDARCQFVITEN